jgi:hypothetical protein
MVLGHHPQGDERPRRNRFIGGNESTLLALYNTMYHWSSIIVPPGYFDPSVSEAFGNPYRTAHPPLEGCPASRPSPQRASSAPCLRFVYGSP